MTPFFENKEEQISCEAVCRMDFPLHLHNHLELFYAVQGEMEMQVGTESYTLKSGELMAVFPGVAHAYRTLRPGNFIMLIVPLSFTFQMKETFQSKLPENPVTKREKIPRQFLENLTELSQTGESPVSEALAYLILARLLRFLPLVPRAEYDSYNLLSGAIGLIGKEYRDDIRLPDIARQLGVSKGYLSKILHNGIGVNFREYVNSLRVSDARNLLANTDREILDIALECGFQNLRTFNRAFRLSVGCTPKEYRRSSRSRLPDPGDRSC